MLRGLGRLDVFPGDDVGAKKKLRNWLHLAGPLSYDEVKKVTGLWHPMPDLSIFTSSSLTLQPKAIYQTYNTVTGMTSAKTLRWPDVR